LLRSVGSWQQGKKYVENFILVFCLVLEAAREARRNKKQQKKYNMNERAEPAKIYIKYNILLGTEPTLKAKNT
jgi:hypothetical protein